MNWDYKNFLIKNRIIVSVALGVTLFSIVGILWLYSNSSIQQSQLNKIQDTKSLIVQQFKETVSDNIDQLVNLKRRLEMTDGAYFDYWSKDASFIVQQDSSYRFIEWIDRSGIIQRVEPMDENRAALGLDITELDYRYPQWAKARDDSVLNFTNWIELVQGQYAFLVDAPVYFNGTFQGTITAGINFEPRFDKIMHGLDQYNIQIRDEQGALFYTHGTPDGIDQYQDMETRLTFQPCSSSLKQWTVKLIPNRVYGEQSPDTGRTFDLAMGLLLCVLLSVSFFFVQKSHAAEKSQRQTNKKLLRSQRIGKMGNWEFEVATNQIHWSPMLYEIYGRDPQKGEPTLDEIQSKYYTRDTDFHNKHVQKALKDGTSFDIDVTLQTEDGSEKFVRIIGIPVTNYAGNVSKLMGTVQDITEEKHLELALRESEERLRATINNVPGIVVRLRTNSEGEIKLLYISEKSKDIWGITPKEALEDSSKIWDRVFNKDIPKLKQTFKNASQHLTKWNEEWRLMKPSGEMRWLEGIGMPKKLEEGTILWDVIILDITERVQLRDELEESEMRLEAAITGADLGVWDLNLKTGENFTNTRWWEMLGYQPDEHEYTYDFFMNLLHPEDKNLPEKAIKEIEDGGENQIDITLRLRGKDGTYRTILDRGRVVEFDEDGTIIRMIGTHMDITEKQKLMDQVVVSTLEGENRERKRIARELHDGIAQYMAASNMNLESIKGSLDQLSKRLISRFNTGLELLGKAMEETRNLAHKLMPGVLQDFGLKVAIQSLADNLEKSSSVTIKCKVDIDESILDQQISTNLYRITQEATTNAIVHGNSSTIQIILQQVESKIQFTISDDGSGMKHPDDQTTNGLGLQSMRHRVHSMSGSIHFKSSPGQGVTIYIELPIPG